MKKICALLLVAALCLLAACGAPDLDSIETAVVEEEGFSFFRPAAWTQTEPASANGVCAFSTEAGDLSLEVVQELGAMEYYSLIELGDKVAETVGDSVFAATPESEERSKDNKYSSTMRGADADGNEVVCRVDLIMPYESVHYYLIYLATPEAYQENSNIADDILNGFTVTKSAEEMYQYINDQRTDAAAAEMDGAGSGDTSAEGGEEQQ